LGDVYQRLPVHLRRLAVFLVFFCIQNSLTGEAAASAWTREKHKILIITRAEYFQSDLGEISVMGDIVNGRFERFESNTYVEFGVTDRIMIGGKVFYGTSWLTRGTDVETASGFSEIEGFAQYQVFRTGRHAGSVKIAAGVPGDLSSGARASLQSNGADAELSLLYGRSIKFEPIKIFAAAEVGYRKRFSDSADQARLLTTIGVEPSERWTFLLDTFTVLSAGNELSGGADYDIVKIQPSVIWRASKRFAVEAGVTQEIAGRNIVLGRTVFVGLRTRF